MKTIEELLKTSVKEVEQMSIFDKREYYERLRDYCASLQIKNQKITFVQKMISKIGPALRKHDYEIRGIENIPDEGALIVCNHSNSHDAFTCLETMTQAKKPATIMVSNEGITPLINSLYNGANFTLIDRSNSASSNAGLYEFSSKLLAGNNCFLFGESTWNLHPLKPMQNLKIGSAKIGAITQKPIVPAVFEYVEVPYLCSKEPDIYKKCIVEFGKPIIIDQEQSMIEQTLAIQKQMEKMRLDLWAELGIKKQNLDDIDTELYLNHTGLKVYGGAGKFDYEREKNCLYSKTGNPEFMYTIDDNGNFVPGELTKDIFLQTLKKHK